MDYVIFTEFVKELGFPIAVCAALFWHNRETVKRFEQSIDKNTEVMGELIKEIRGN